ncbi:hypothetical protein TNIN_152741 [Trichonephila inaurata madagascariensis]|uniref:Uncharacterized protein n=1 Tax=Trichonephila inaurata madagascariensis TaxID=2747483 RepID=A0A8X6ILP5_9ARAC|nr:hypothetical protein TNIN_152741 [Trichonephila inaurata madagascariensis]
MIEKQEVRIEESFIDFNETKNKTEEGISNIAVSKLETDGLDIMYYRGQVCHNAATMAGCHTGTPFSFFRIYTPPVQPIERSLTQLQQPMPSLPFRPSSSQQKHGQSSSAALPSITSNSPRTSATLMSRSDRPTNQEETFHCLLFQTLASITELLKLNELFNYLHNSPGL